MIDYGDAMERIPSADESSALPVAGHEHRRRGTNGAAEVRHPSESGDDIDARGDSAMNRSHEPRSQRKA